MRAIENFFFDSQKVSILVKRSGIHDIDCARYLLGVSDSDAVRSCE